MSNQPNTPTKSRSRRSLDQPGGAGATPPPPTAPPPTGMPGAPDAGGPKGPNSETGVMMVLFRGVNLASPTMPSANSDIAYAVETALKANPLFDKDETHLEGNIDSGDASGTFTFGVSLKLKRPIKL